MSHEFLVDWDRMLADDGSLPFVSPLNTSPAFEEHQRPLLTLEASKPAKRSAVAPRRRADDIVVEESGSSFGLGIVDCALYFETRWTCAACKTSYKKPGRHNGVLKKCRGCGARFFLRLTPLSGG